MVPEEGLEPTQPCGYQILSLARLPIPPLRQVKGAKQRTIMYMGRGDAATTGAK